MPNGAKNPGSNDTAKTAALPFEEALKKLESIVEAMESHDMPLESLLHRFQEGTELARMCQEKLAAAELKVRQLEQDSAGSLSLKPLPELTEAD